MDTIHVRFATALRTWVAATCTCLWLGAVVSAAEAPSAPGAAPAPTAPTTSNIAPPPAAAFAALPAETEATQTPDGHWLAWIDQTQSRARVVIFEMATRKIKRVLAVPEFATLERLFWNDNETLLCLIRVAGKGWHYDSTKGLGNDFYLMAADVSAGPVRMLPATDPPTAARLVRWRVAKPHTVIMEAWGFCGPPRSLCLFEVNTQTGANSVIRVGNELSAQFVVDRNGRAVAREDWDWHAHEFRVFALSDDGTDSIREIYHTRDDEQPHLRGLLPDGSALVLIAANGHSHQAAWALPLDGAPMELLAEDPDADISGTYTDPYNGAIIGVYASGHKGNVQWLEPAAQHRYDVLARSFHSTQVQLIDWTADGTRTIAYLSSPARAPTYQLVDFTTNRADIVAEGWPALRGFQQGEVTEITYRARDGTQIPAYLAVPPSKGSAPVPLVVLPHDGPNDRDYFLWNSMVQFLVSRGYAVLQPQFRGSGGFGEAFRIAGYRQWGGLMQDDVTDGVNAMVRDGIADPHRICIVGQELGGYSGYAALAGAAFTPDVYACAVSVNGIADLPALMREFVPDGYRGFSSSQLRYAERVGAPKDPKLAARSPSNSAKSIKIPVLIMYGTSYVSNEQSMRMESALRAAGKSVDVVKIPGKDDWAQRTDTRVLVYSEIEKFLRKHL